MNFVGIQNVGDFYSPHYFRSLVTDDIKGLVDDWKTEHDRKGRRLPWNALEGVASEWSDAYAEAAETPDPADRWDLTRDVHVELLQALGYEYDPQAVSVGDTGSGRVIPAICTETRDGQPWLWAVEAPMPTDEDAGAFEEPILPEQLAAMPGFENLGRGPNAPSADALLPWNGELDAPASWQQVFDEQILAMESPPRWMMFFAGRSIALIDRHKWGQGQYLRFDLQELFDRREAQTLRAVCALLHRDAINPDEKVPLLEELETESHKHAHSVSTELRHSAREAIELVGNEIVWYRRNVANKAVFSWEPDSDGPDDLAEALTEDCLTFLYRLLFLLYAEARGGELGIVPTDSEAYRQGYSIESLRDLELKRLETDRARNGHYIHETLRRLFRIVNEGFNDRGSRSLPFEPETAQGLGASPSSVVMDEAEEGEAVEETSNTFVVDGLQSRLFDDDRLNILGEVKLRNVVLQKVIRLLSLSDADSGERDRISYADLGINQLGSVYEGLLSYDGFFAHEKRYEVRDPDDMNERDPRAWFVEASDIDEYRDEEIVTHAAEGVGVASTAFASSNGAPAASRQEEGDDRPVTYKKGTFLYRRAGRTREQTASYYTPKALTECLTKYTLKERIGKPPAPGWEEEWDPEDEREELEADELLDLTICEPAMGSGSFLNEAVDQLADRYLEKKQKELGESLAPDRYRREKRKVMYYLATHNCYGVDLNPMAAELGKISMWLNVLHADAKAPWFDARISVGNSIVGTRRAVYRPDALRLKGDADWRTDPPELVREMPENDNEDTGGRASLPSRPDGMVYHFLLPAKGMCPFDDVDEFEEFAADHQDRISAWRKQFTRPLDEEEIERLQALSNRIDDIWAQHLRDRCDVLRETAPPLDIYGQPSPDRDQWPTAEECDEAAARLRDADAAGRRLKRAMDDWCALWFWPTRESESLPTREAFWDGIEARLEPGDSGESIEHLDVAREVADRYTYQHWEAEFPEVFAVGGFDVVIGNPPWIDVAWSEREVLSELDSRVAIRNYSGSEASSERFKILEQSPNGFERYLDAAEYTVGRAQFYSAQPNYPKLEGHRANTYKNFICRSWSLNAATGTAGLLHPDGVFHDPRGDKLRSTLLHKVESRYQFRNELRLFEEVSNHSQFSLTIYRKQATDWSFFQICSLFHPATIDASLHHDGLGPVPGRKNDDGAWQLRGHRNRVILFTKSILELCNETLGSNRSDRIRSTEVPLLFSRVFIGILNSIRGRVTLADAGQWYCSREWNEGERQNDGTLVRDTHWPDGPRELVYSGPSVFVANPLYKTPNSECKSNRDYSVIDLEKISSSFLPRSTYRISCDSATYLDRSPEWKGDVFWDRYRHAHREYVDTTSERTLAGGVLPAGASNVASLISLAFEDLGNLLHFNGIVASLVYDSIPKITGREHLNVDFLSTLPWGKSSVLTSHIRSRAARLNCLTAYYRELWESCFREQWNHHEFTVDTSNYPQLVPWANEVAPNWTMDSALRNRFERRQALVELDALAALALGLTADQLCTIYRIQFPVLREYENKTFYDQRGKIVYSRKANFGVVGIGEFRKFRDAQTTEEVLDAAREEYHEELEDFEPPFVGPLDREADMRNAYETFEERLDYSVEGTAEVTEEAEKGEEKQSERTAARTARLTAREPRPWSYDQKRGVPGDASAVPVLEPTAEAGTFSSDTDEPYEGWAAVDGVSDARNHFVVEIEGDSMAPEIEDGDLLMFRRVGYGAEGGGDGSVCLVQLHEYSGARTKQLVVKEFEKSGDGGLVLRSWNPDAEDLQVKEGDDVEIHGVLRGRLETEAENGRLRIAGAERPSSDDDKKTDADALAELVDGETAERLAGEVETAESLQQASSTVTPDDGADPAPADLEEAPEESSEVEIEEDRAALRSDEAEDVVAAAEGSSPETTDQAPTIHVPQANNLDTLRDVLDQLAGGRRRHAEIADRLGISERTVRYYLDLGAWLGLAETSGDGTDADGRGRPASVRNPARRTELGRRFTGDAGAAKAIARRRLEATPLLRAVRSEPSWPGRPREAVRAVIERRTGLSDETAERRADGVASLLEQVGLPQEGRPQGEFEVFGARDLPVGVLDPPGSIGAVLDEYDLRTLGDVLELEIESVEQLRGVGPAKADDLRELHERARQAAGGGEGDRRCPTEPDPLAGGVADALREAGLSSKEPWEEVALEIPTRIESGLEDAGVHLLGELVGVLAHVGLEQLPNVGETTAGEWRARLELLAAQGWEAYRFGPGGRPETVSELVEHFMAESTPREREILRRRVLEDLTYDELAESVDLTRQRIRQLFAGKLEELSERYGKVAADLTAPLRAVLEGDGVGLVHRLRARRTVGTGDLYHLVLVLRVAGVGDAVTWHENFIRTETKTDLRQAVTDLENEFRGTDRLFLRVDDVLRFADEVGFELSVHALEDLLRVASDAEPDRRGRFRNPRATKGDRVAEALREARRPLTIDELAERFEATYAEDDEKTGRDVAQRYAKSHPQIYTVDYGEYVHRESLPVDEDALEEVVDRCIDYLRGKRHAVSTVWMLEEMRQTDLASGGRLDGLTPMLLRDVLIRHEKVGTKVSSYNVAWEPTYAYEDVTLPDRIERILRAAGKPVHLDDVVAAFPEDFYVHPGSVEQTLEDADWAMEMGERRFAHTDSVALQPQERRNLIEAVVDALPGPDEALGTESDGDQHAVWSAHQVWDAIADTDAAAPLRGAAEGRDADPPELLFGLVRGDDRLASETPALLARRDAVASDPSGEDDNPSLFDRALVDVVHDEFPVYPREVAEIGRKRLGLDRSNATFKRHLHELFDDGQLGRLTSGLYFPADLTDQDLFEGFRRADRDLVEITERSDFEELPDDELWLLARYFDDVGRLTDAKKVLDVLTSREDVEKPWQQKRAEIRRKLKELL